METIELLKYINQLFQENWGVGLPTGLFAMAVFLVGVGTLFVKLVQLLSWGWRRIENLNQKPWRKEQIKKILSPDYSDQLREQKYFISTKFTTTPPNNLEDPSEVERTESAKNLIEYFLDHVLVEDNTTNRFYCILAGAGMGKTTWTVNLVTSYINHYKKNNCPYNIKLISLAHKDFANAVRQVGNAQETILILDALDENADASADIAGFMRSLETLIQNFRFVILTSRTQFFPSEDEEPHKTSILNLSGEKGNHVYHKMYISPFSQEDVTEFLKKKYRKRKTRKKAEEIIKRCKSLATRPLLLSHLDDILESNQEYFTLSEIYTALINAWIKREVRFASGGEDAALCNKLYDFSLHFALELFANRERSTNMRMAKDQYTAFINANGYTDYNFSGRSLINRDAVGTMKFSHKTFYEYFLAKAKLENPELSIPELGYELAWEFYRELVETDFIHASCARMLVNGDDAMSMICYGTSHPDYDYRKLIGVFDITHVCFPSKMLNYRPNFLSWLSRSNIEIVDIVDYNNEPLKILLNLPHLKRVRILTYGGKGSSLRSIVTKLEKKGIEVNIQSYPIRLNRYQEIVKGDEELRQTKQQQLYRHYAEALGVDMRIVQRVLSGDNLSFVQYGDKEE